MGTAGAAGSAGARGGPAAGGAAALPRGANAAAQRRCLDVWVSELTIFIGTITKHMYS